LFGQSVDQSQTWSNFCETLAAETLAAKTLAAKRSSLSFPRVAEIHPPGSSYFLG